MWNLVNDQFAHADTDAEFSITFADLVADLTSDLGIWMDNSIKIHKHMQKLCIVLFIFATAFTSASAYNADFFADFCNGLRISMQISALGCRGGIVRMSTYQFAHAL